MSAGGRAALLAALAFGVFSSHDALIKLLGDEYSVFQIMFFSMLFGFPPIAMQMASEKALDNFRPHRPFLVALRGVTVLLTMSTIFFAFTRLPMAQVYAILFTTPLIITMLSVPLLGESVGPRRWAAVLVGFVGVLIVVRPGAVPLDIGHGAALIGACCNAFGAIIVRKIGPQERSVVLILYPSMLILLVMSVLMQGSYVAMPLPDLAMMAAIGLLAFAGQMLTVSAYKIGKASLVAPMQYSQILWAAVFGLVLFDERPDRWMILGAMVIIGSGLYIVWREAGPRASGQRPVTRTGNMRSDAGVSTDPKGKYRQE